MYPEFLFKKYLKELQRPWKLITLSIALAYYLWGAYYYNCPTWDMPVSLIMGILTYVFTPGTVKEVVYLIRQRPRRWSFKLLICGTIIYFCASGSYELYNWWNLGYHPPPTYWVNLYYSTLMFIAAGMVWKFEGTFKTMIKSLKNDIVKKKTGK